MSRLQIAIILIAGALVLWGLTKLAGSPVVYDSVHEVGYRAGLVLPQGYDGGSELVRDQHVRINPVPEQANPSRPPASVKARTGPTPHITPVRSGSEWMILTLLVMGCAIGSLIGAARARRWAIEDRGNRSIDLKLMRRRMVRACLMVVPIGLMIGTAFVLTRIFWTGVDDAFIDRSMRITPQLNSVHVTGDTTLSMNLPELMMLYLALIMTALPLSYIIACSTMGGAGGLRAHWSKSKIISPIKSVLSRRAIQQRLSTQSISGVALACYVVLTLIFWSAPWSTTMARAIWAF